jgi:hypothetical protein
MAPVETLKRQWSLHVDGVRQLADRPRVYVWNRYVGSTVRGRGGSVHCRRCSRPFKTGDMVVARGDGFVQLATIIPFQFPLLGIFP